MRESPKLFLHMLSHLTQDTSTCHFILSTQHLISLNIPHHGTHQPRTLLLPQIRSRACIFTSTRPRPGSHCSYLQAASLCEDSRDKAAASEIAAELLNDLQCPVLIKIQALQLQSTCTSDFDEGQKYLRKALEMLKSLNDDEDEMVRKYRIHTVSRSRPRTVVVC